MEDRLVDAVAAEGEDQGKQGATTRKSAAGRAAPPAAAAPQLASGAESQQEDEPRTPPPRLASSEVRIGLPRGRRRGRGRRDGVDERAGVARERRHVADQLPGDERPEGEDASGRLGDGRRCGEADGRARTRVVVVCVGVDVCVAGCLAVVEVWFADVVVARGGVALPSGRRLRRVRSGPGAGVLAAALARSGRRVGLSVRPAPVWW